jgi:hypothetical protein
MLCILVAEQLLASEEGNSTMDKFPLLSCGKYSFSHNVKHNFEGCKVYREYKQIRGCPAGECCAMSLAT